MVSWVTRYDNNFTLAQDDVQRMLLEGAKPWEMTLSGGKLQVQLFQATVKAYGSEGAGWLARASHSDYTPQQPLPWEPGNTGKDAAINALKALRRRLRNKWQKATVNKGIEVMPDVPARRHKVEGVVKKWAVTGCLTCPFDNPETDMHTCMLSGIYTVGNMIPERCPLQMGSVVVQIEERRE